MLRVYKFGLRAQITGAELVAQQFREAHNYRNELCAIDRNHRKERRSLRAQHPIMAPLQAELDQLLAKREVARAELARVRSVGRGRSESPEMRKEIRAFGAAIKAIREKMKAESPAVNAELKTELKTLKVQVELAKKRAYKVSQVYWGTKLLQLAAAKQANRGKMDPKFRRGSRFGRVGVQLQKGITLDGLIDNTQLQIVDATPDTPEQLAKRLAHAQACGTVFNPDKRRRLWKRLRLRIGSSGNQPVWAEWPMTMHRDIPGGGGDIPGGGVETITKIKSATVQRKRRNCRPEQDFWEVNITADIDPIVARKPLEIGAVALNVGFCIRPDGGIRAGYLVGSDGEEIEVCLPKDIPESLAVADATRSKRDKLMDVMKAEFSVWRATLQEKHDKLVLELGGETAELVEPGDEFVAGFRRLGEYIKRTGFDSRFLDRMRYIHAWRSAEKFRSLAYYWRKHRFDGDQVGFDVLEAWRYKDERLECYESGTRRKALLRRREFYRVLGAKLARRYRDLVIDDIDLAALQASPKPESEDTEIALVKRNQRLAACHQLRTVLANAFSSHVRKVSAIDKTAKCHLCGKINQWDRLTSGRLHTCDSCGVQWDQDMNFGMNALAEHRLDWDTWEANRKAELKKVKLSLSQIMKKKRDEAKAAAAAAAAAEDDDDADEVEDELQDAELEELDELGESEDGVEDDDDVN